ncbi:endoglucanase A-like [Nematostella vectensis]|uniref:endoglucanase A-like n=1 Tax=Nematostella vectensis TaxID=45351 RepID=UPI002076E599|nr:endoglucanase A-like [Nematostella vectensis]
MKWLYLVLLGIVLVPLVISKGDVEIRILSDWNTGFEGSLLYKVTEEVDGGWEITLSFDQPLRKLEIWEAKIKSTSEDKKTFVISNFGWNTHLNEGSVLEMPFNGVKGANGGRPHVTATFHARGDEESGDGDFML